MEYSMMMETLVYENMAPSDLAPPPMKGEVWLLGRKYSLPEEKGELTKDIKTRFWCTYRKNFKAISGTSITCDQGWGCTLRCGQMVMANTLLFNHLGRDWRWPVEDREDEQTYTRILRKFLDSRYSDYSLQMIAQQGADFGRPVGQWFGPNNVAQALKKLSVHDDWTRLAVHVAMDMVVVVEDIKALCRQSHRRKPSEVKVEIASLERQRSVTDPASPMYPDSTLFTFGKRGQLEDVAFSASTSDIDGRSSLERRGEGFQDGGTTDFNFRGGERRREVGGGRRGDDSRNIDIEGGRRRGRGGREAGGGRSGEGGKGKESSEGRRRDAGEGKNALGRLRKLSRGGSKETEREKMEEIDGENFADEQAKTAKTELAKIMNSHVTMASQLAKKRQKSNWKIRSKKQLSPIKSLDFLRVDGETNQEDVREKSSGSEDEEEEEEEQREGRDEVDRGGGGVARGGRGGGGGMNRPLLLFIPLRLGQEKFNMEYKEALKACLTLPQSVGIIGGKPRHALYFIGFHDDDLLYLDPHTTQPAVPVTDLSVPIPDQTYHCPQADQMCISELDPSIALAFYCRDEQDIDNMCKNIRKNVLSKMQYLFELTDKRPPYWGPLERNSITSIHEPFFLLDGAPPSPQFTCEEDSDGFEVIDFV